MKRPKVLNLSTHNEPCGIAKYQELFVQSLNQQRLAFSSFFEVSPNTFKNQPESEKRKSLDTLERALKGHDILHIQHEFSFFHGDDLGRFVNLAKNNDKQVVITIHTPPSLAWPKSSLSRITGLSSLRSNLAARREITVFNNELVKPLLAADLIICPNKTIAKEIVSLGIRPEAVKHLPHPVPKAPKSSVKFSLINNHLCRSEHDVILGIIGFITYTKGIHHAIDALSFLPANYKLAVIGGLHPSHGQHSDYLQQILNRIIDRGLQSRFYLTGYIEDDSELISATSECDICLFPFDLEYYRAVSSASIGIATASHKPAIAFPTPAFEELSLYNKSIQVCSLANGYELAREAIKMNIEEKSNEAVRYSAECSYDAVASMLAILYTELTP